MGQGLIQCFESNASEFSYLSPLSWLPLGLPAIFSTMHLILSCISDFEKGFSCRMQWPPFCLPKKSQNCVLTFEFHQLCFLPSNLLSAYLPLIKIQKSYHGPWGQMTPAPSCRRPGFREQRNRDGRDFGEGLLLKSSLQQPGRSRRAVVAAVKVQPGCLQSTVMMRWQKRTQQMIVFRTSGQRQWRRKERSNSCREDRSPGQKPLTKTFLLLLREESVMSPSFQDSLGRYLSWPG